MDQNCATPYTPLEEDTADGHNQQQPQQQPQYQPQYHGQAIHTTPVSQHAYPSVQPAVVPGINQGIPNQQIILANPQSTQTMIANPQAVPPNPQVIQQFIPSQPVMYSQAPVPQMVMQPQSVMVPQAGQSYNAGAPTQIVYLAYSPSSRTPINYTKFDRKTSMILGSLQIALALLAIIVQSVGYNIQIRISALHTWDTADAFDSFPGVWCAVFFLVSGGFAVAAGKSKNKCLIITTLVLSIVALTFSFILMGFASAVVDHDSNAKPYYIYDRSGYGNRRYSSTTPSDYLYVIGKQRHYYEVSLAMGAVMLVSALAEVMMSLWLMILCTKLLCACGKGNSCCCGCCCCCPKDSMSGQQVRYVNNGSVGQMMQVVNSPNIQSIPSQQAYQLAQPVNHVPQLQPEAQSQTQGVMYPPPYTT